MLQSLTSESSESRDPRAARPCDFSIARTGYPVPHLQEKLRTAGALAVVVVTVNVRNSPAVTLIFEPLQALFV